MVLSLTDIKTALEIIRQLIKLADNLQKNEDNICLLRDRAKIFENRLIDLTAEIENNKNNNNQSLLISQESILSPLITTLNDIKELILEYTVRPNSIVENAKNNISNLLFYKDKAKRIMKLNKDLNQIAFDMNLIDSMQHKQQTIADMEFFQTQFNSFLEDITKELNEHSISIKENIQELKEDSNNLLENKLTEIQNIFYK